MSAAVFPNQAVALNLHPKLGELICELLRAVGIKDLPRELRGRRRGGKKTMLSAPRFISVNGLCRQYLRFAEKYYRHTDGTSTRESEHIEYAQRVFKELFGPLSAHEIGPVRLKQVREKMVERGWCRRQINQQVGRIKRMYRWAASNELVPGSVYQALSSVDGLRAGRSQAKESFPVKPAPEDQIQAVLPLVSPQVAAMIHLQLITGMRPGEVLIMRACDIDQSEVVWRYTPSRHKTEHHDHKRFIYLGPQCQKIIQPFLDAKLPDEFLFAPADADRVRRAHLHSLRKTPMSCGHRPGNNRKRHPKRKPGDRYETQSYARAITYACERAFPFPEDLPADQRQQWRREHHWHPHQLRHNAATRLRKEFGLDVAQVILGHKTLAITQIYAEKDTEAAKRVMASTG